MKVVIVTPSHEINKAIVTHSTHLADTIERIGGFDVQIKKIGRANEVVNHYIGNTIDDFIELANCVNESADVCLLQYDPQAYQGACSKYILVFVNKLRLPLLTFCHSVNNNPSELEKMVVGILTKRSQRILAKNQLEIDFLEHYYKINQEQLLRLEYGIPDGISRQNKLTLNSLNLRDKKVMLSTGYLSPEKGYETVINAMPAILNYYPEMIYLIVGSTDSGEKELRGEEYRKTLMRLAMRRGVSEQVIFYSGACSESDVIHIMKQADLYIAPDINEQSLNNYDLSLAIGAGSVILSTPSWIAQQMLAEDKGQFFSFKSSGELAQLVINTMRSKKERSSYKEITALYGAQFTWEKIGQKLDNELKIVVDNSLKVSSGYNPVLQPELLPDWKPDHLLKMFNGIGLLSSCLFDVVDYKKGYKLLENAMAIQVMAMAGGNGIENNVIKAGLAFIKYMENEDGSWSSGLTFDQQRMDQAGDYVVGRTIWALGSLYGRTKSDEVKDVAFSLIYKLLMQEREFSDVNAKACALIGAAHVLESGNPDPELYETIKLYANQILRLIPEELGNKWQWYESELTGRYGVVPLALAYTHRIVGDMRYLSAARRTCRFVEKQLFVDGVFNPSVAGYSKEKPKLTKGNEQSSNEAFYMVACYAKLFDITREPIYLNQLKKVHFWYLGENNLMKSVYDNSRGGCYEGLSIRGVIPNKGSESTCSFWLSHYTYLEAYFKELESIDSSR